MAFNVVKKFLDENTVSKINIYKNGSDKWKESLFTHVDPNTFPKCFGGNYVDENGDPECKSKVRFLLILGKFNNTYLYAQIIRHRLIKKNTK